ncbi:hypothetical protein F4804DRAFT_55375 [Jackrogersella minutella]|nr:hypothetical protein F4804DRAFT_55375 [Jackrogersella minutella]
MSENTQSQTPAEGQNTNRRDPSPTRSSQTRGGGGNRGVQGIRGSRGGRGDRGSRGSRGGRGGRGGSFGSSDDSQEVKIVVSWNTRIIFPPPQRKEISPPKGSHITLSKGDQIIFPDGLIAGGSIAIQGNKISHVPADTWIVLSGAAKLSPGDRGEITLPDGITLSGVNSGLALPAGTMVYFGLRPEPRYRFLTEDTTLSSEFIIPIAGSITLTDSITIPKGGTIRLGGDITLSGDAMLPGGVILAGAVNIDDKDIPAGTTLAKDYKIFQGIDMPAGTTLLGGTVIAAGVKLPGGTSLPAGITIPRRSTLHHPMTLPVTKEEQPSGQ